MEPSNHSNRNHAVVMGGSMGGLLAARVLSDFFRSVTIIERDVLPTSCENRRGVPQGRHTHGLLAGGAQVLERHYPGILSELKDAGAVTGDIAGKARWFNEGACLARFESGLTGMVMSRPFLESRVRARTAALPNVTIKHDCAVGGLTATPDNSRVTGVRCADGTDIPADLVVDTTGRGSKTPQWLEAIGFAKAPEEQVQVGLSYTTRLFRRRPTDLNGDIVVVTPPTPEGKCGGVMLAQENDRWTVTLIRHFGPGAPSELDGFREFARNLPAPFIHDVIKDAEPLGDAVTAKFPASIRRRYEKLTRFPEAFLVFGDAISSFNPIYGQGMTAAALESLELQSALRAGDSKLAKRFFARAGKVVDTPWSIAVGNDLRMPETVGPRNPGVRFINWYMSRLHRAAHTDPQIALAFHRVANLLAPPPSVMHPRIAARVLWRNLFPPRRTESEQPMVAAQSA